LEASTTNAGDDAQEMSRAFFILKCQFRVAFPEGLELGLNTSSAERIVTTFSL